MITGITEMWSLQRCVKKKTVSYQTAADVRVLHTDHDGAPHTGYRGCCLNVMELLFVSWEFHSTFDSVHCASLWSDRSSGSIWHHNASQEAVQRCEMASNNNNTELNHLLFHGALKKTEFKVFRGRFPSIPARKLCCSVQQYLQLSQSDHSSLGANRGPLLPHLPDVS